MKTHILPNSRDPKDIPHIPHTFVTKILVDSPVLVVLPCVHYFFYLSGNRNITKELQGTPWKHTSWPWATGRRVATRSCAPRGPGPSPPKEVVVVGLVVFHIPGLWQHPVQPCCGHCNGEWGERIANKSISNSDIVNICNYNNSSSDNNNSNNM